MTCSVPPLACRSEQWTPNDSSQATSYAARTAAAGIPSHKYREGTDYTQEMLMWDCRGGSYYAGHHDLRRQFACTLLESEADLHDVQDFLGHAAITTTSRYLQSTPTRLEKALARMEGGGFAQDSHTEAPEAPAATAESEAADRPNLFN